MCVFSKAKRKYLLPDSLERGVRVEQCQSGSGNARQKQVEVAANFFRKQIAAEQGRDHHENGIIVCDRIAQGGVGNFALKDTGCAFKIVRTALEGTLAGWGGKTTEASCFCKVKVMEGEGKKDGWKGGRDDEGDLRGGSVHKENADKEEGSSGDW